MTLRLTVDAPAWRAHLDRMLREQPTLVPVMKGNGYGFGLSRLAAEARRMGVARVAVNGAAEVEVVRREFPGEVMVLEPWRPALTPADPGVLVTVSRPDLLERAGQAAAFVVEAASPMRRHGIELGEDVAPRLRAAISSGGYRGLAVHLPISGIDRLGAIRRVLADWGSLGVPLGPIWVSHLDAGELRALQAEHPASTLYPRVGTDLWLGAPAALHADGEVLDVHPVRRGEPVGYFQRRAPGSGWVVVVSGGTAHGIGMRGRSAGRSRAGRLRALARDVAAAAGLTGSPFQHDGRRLAFADLPHMQVSMLFVPAGLPPLHVGDRLTCVVRMTTTDFDEVLLTSGRSEPGLLTPS